MADINNNLIPKDVLTLNNYEHCPVRKAKKVVGTTDLGVCERLSTEETQASIYLYEQYIYGVVANYLIYLLTISDNLVLFKDSFEATTVTDNNKTGDNHSAILNAGVGYKNEGVLYSAEKTELSLLDRDDVYNNGCNNHSATLDQIATTNPFVSSITRRANRGASNAFALTHAFAQLDLHADDVSSDFNIRAVLRLWNEEAGVYHIVLDYALYNFKGPQPNAFISEDFDIPVVGDWNSDDGRFGYFEFTSPTNVTPATLSSMRINLKSYQFIGPKP